MLHSGILPNHRSWPQLFWKNLKLVVLDEAHVYSGVFGSHASLVMRRLSRLVRSYKGESTFICCSATIGNPAAHVERLTGRVPCCVTQSGAPVGPKALLLWQPMLLERAARAAGDDEGAAEPQRRSLSLEAGDVLAELVASGLRPLAFVPARKMAETVADATRKALKARSLHAAADGGVGSYRAGYSPEERRALGASLSAPAGNSPLV